MCGCLRVAQAAAKQQRALLSRRSGYAVPAAGKPLEPFTYEVGPLGANEVDIRVTHNGLCHTDMHMKDDDWGISRFPFIPGHEVVGVVAGAGESVKGLAPGDRVAVGWVVDSCRSCAACLRGDENLCEKGYTGLIVMGERARALHLTSDRPRASRTGGGGAGGGSCAEKWQALTPAAAPHTSALLPSRHHAQHA